MDHDVEPTGKELQVTQADKSTYAAVLAVTFFYEDCPRPKIYSVATPRRLVAAEARARPPPESLFRIDDQFWLPPQSDFASWLSKPKLSLSSLRQRKDATWTPFLRRNGQSPGKYCVRPINRMGSSPRAVSNQRKGSRFPARPLSEPRVFEPGTSSFRGGRFAHCATWTSPSFLASFSSASPRCYLALASLGKACRDVHAPGRDGAVDAEAFP